MAGGLLTITLASLSDAAFSRTAGATMGFTFVGSLSLYAVVLCGLVDHVLPGLPRAVMDLLKVVLGPLCSTMAMVFAGQWLRVRGEDEWIARIVFWGTALLGVASLVLGLLTVLAEPADIPNLLLASAAACVLTIVLTGICAWRAWLLGDVLAKWVAPSAVALSVTITGLYHQAVEPGSLPLLQIAATGFSAVAYLLIIAMLSIVRTRQARRLQRLAGLQINADPVTGLPTGSALLAKVDDAFWRASRNGLACNVVCMHLHNLYQLAEEAGHGVEQQIALAMSARIRRAMGFRCVVGLYHARCFVAVIQVPRQSSGLQIQSYVQRLGVLISKPVDVVGHGRIHYTFEPQWGISVVSSDPSQTDSIHVLRQAEQEAMNANFAATESELVTRPG